MEESDLSAETREWLEALNSVQEFEGVARVDGLLSDVVAEARKNGAKLPFAWNTAYINTIPPEQQPPHPGVREVETKIRAAIRWNAAMLVLKANKASSELGGHIASFQSAATLYDVGFMHFWRAPHDHHAGDLVFIQGHSSPGIYARAFLEGRISEEQMLNFRQEVDGKGLSSYPHPWLMPDFWQFPTVSMGLGPLMAIYQARFLRYLEGRGLIETHERKVWAFMGDGEMDEPESLGAISLAGREKLDNLVFVINCNLQRLDGPVRGNGKIIQELEADFRGAGWNVIKVIWGTTWDELLARDYSGRLRQLMEECVDGEYQDFKSKSGAYIREKFFGRYPETAEMVRDWSDEKIWRLTRGGHDSKKIYAAYRAAVEHKGQPTVILAKTVKGYGMGSAGEAQMMAHQAKKMSLAALTQFRDRFNIPVVDSELEHFPFIKFPEGSEEMNYLRARREALGGYLPARRRQSEPLVIPPLSAFEAQLKATDGREISTTMSFVRVLNTLLRDKNIGKRIVPIVPDESRTFGMEGMFRQYGIFSQVGQLYRPQDADQLSYYKEDRSGQMLQEGINEAGAMASWIAAATSYSHSNTPMIPFYIYYSMFGFQRVHDLAWAAGDLRARGFLLGGTSGRTTLNGEGLQHEDGHSHILSATIPNCVSYDATFSYEVAVIVRARAGAHVWQGRGRLFLSDAAQRELRTSRHAGRRGGRHRQGHVSVQGGAGRNAEGEESHPARLRRDPARGHRRRGAAGARFRHSRRYFRGDELHRTQARGRRLRALEHDASDGGGRAFRTSPSFCRSAATARWWRPPTISAPSPSRSAAMSRPATRCWGRMASGARIIAASCAPSSKWTAIMSRSRR